MVDYHIHSRISPDGRDSMESICMEAIQKGIEELVFTEHFECYTPDFDDHRFDEPYLEEYAKEFQRCKEQFGRKLSLRFGLELGQPHMNPAVAKRVLSAYAFDYVIGSVHKLENRDLSTFSYQTGDVAAQIAKNLDSLQQLAESGDFDCLGHADLIKRYAAKQQVKIDLFDCRERMEKLFRTLAQRGKGLELNTSGLRQEAKEALPSLHLLALFRRCGGEILTIGSDAHRACDIGADWKEACCLAKEAGFSSYAVYQDRKVSFQKFDLNIDSI